MRLLPQKAPKAVENFVGSPRARRPGPIPTSGKQVTQPLYDGTLFHRVIPGFMIQGGDPLSRGAPLGETASVVGRPFGTGDPGFRFADELEKPPAKPFAKACQLAMANSGPNTNGSQFFITEAATPWLDPEGVRRAGRRVRLRPLRRGRLRLRARRADRARRQRPDEARQGHHHEQGAHLQVSGVARADDPRREDGRKTWLSSSTRRSRLPSARSS